jgi:hypothetical protein
MASRGFRHNAGVLGAARKDIDLTFYPNGTGTPTFVGQGVESVVFSTTGTFLITLQDGYYQLWSKFATVQRSTAADLVAQFGDISNLGTGNPVTVVVRLLAGATPTNLAADPNNSVSVKLSFNDSTV